MGNSGPFNDPIAVRGTKLPRIRANGERMALLALAQTLLAHLAQLRASGQYGMNRPRRSLQKGIVHRMAPRA